jgi:hypothetical protein
MENVIEILEKENKILKNLVIEQLSKSIKFKSKDQAQGYLEEYLDIVTKDEGQNAIERFLKN